MSDVKENTGFFGNMSEVKLNELRRMIVGLDTEDLQRLANLVNDPDSFSKEISHLLPNSIKLLIDQGKVSYTDLIPMIEAALKDSIQKDPHTLSEILFPVMLPAIRKAVADDIRNMINSLNTTLEHGFSPKRIGWRFKALFSGMSYAEIVLSHAYIYRVKQVFLIHKSTGLLLNSVADNEDSVTKDEDMVSSMLSAIKDFVQDSFSVSGDNELNTIKVGKFNIWIEQGPAAILAIVIDGDAPSSFRNILKETVEKIHLKNSLELESFTGNIDDFLSTTPYLQNCLVSEQKEKKKKKPVLIIILTILALGYGGYWAYLNIEKGFRIGDLEKSLNSEPGIVITDKDKNDGKVIFMGLRDPDAVDPVDLAKSANVDTSEIDFQFKSYISLDDKVILARAYKILSPPSGVKFHYYNGVLYLIGNADEDWISSAKSNYRNIGGVDGLNTEKINLVTNKKVAKRVALSIEQYYFVFEYNIIKLNNEQEIKFESLINEVNTVLDFDFAQDSVPVINVIAHTSYEGNPEANEKTAFDRAQQFINFMIEAGIPMEVLVPQADFIEDIDEEFPIRSVSFKVVYSKPEDL